MATFELCEIPAVEEEEKVREEEVPPQRSSVPSCNPQVYQAQLVGAPLVGPWRILCPAEVANLSNLLQIPLPYHRVHHVVTHRVDGTSEHAYISCLPGHHAFIGGTFLHSSEWGAKPSISYATGPVLAPRPLAWRAPPPGDAASADFDPRRSPWSNGGGTQCPQTAAGGQTTTVDFIAGMDQNRGGSEQ